MSWRRFVSVLVAMMMFLFVGDGLGCRNEQSNHQLVYRMADRTIEQVQEAYTDQWMAIPGIVGTAIGECDGEPCILVLTASDTEQVRRQIPATVDGYPVVVRHTGEVRALGRK